MKNKAIDLVSRDGHAWDGERGHVRRVFEGEVIRRDEVSIHLAQITGDGDFAHWVGAHAVFDPEP